MFPKNRIKEAVGLTGIQKKQQICAERYSPRIKGTPLRQTFASFHKQAQGKASIVYLTNKRRADRTALFLLRGAQHTGVIRRKKRISFQNILCYNKIYAAKALPDKPSAQPEPAERRENAMAYSELIKNFEKIRAYMREFYVYGFKSRTENDAKSARSYDDERRRLESWLGDYMRFAQTPEGKTVFLSIDSRATQRNPLYKAWKSKSFTDKDITLHFLLFDILSTPEVKKTLSELVEEIDRRLCVFENPMTFDESTVRKKLKEYAGEGIVRIEKDGRRTLYGRTPDPALPDLRDVIDFFSEAAPCGVIGSYLQDKLEPNVPLFTFKHHYITQAMDSGVLALLFDAMHKKCRITADNLGRHSEKAKALCLVPLKIYISAQNGRQHLLAFHEQANRLNAYRLDYLSNVRLGEPCASFDTLRRALENAEAHMWGVNGRLHSKRLEHVEFDVRVADGEAYIVRRLEREKRCGRVEKLDAHSYRFSADVFDTNEMLPWIRSFLSRITSMRFSNRSAENKFKADLQAMYDLYGIGGGEKL